ncbi:MAG: SpoIIE family protein phosphatase [Acidobacteria bacterium]|nr:SpoIIE family protein phosphatase [Acidobacteriota bacterium]
MARAQGVVGADECGAPTAFWYRAAPEEWSWLESSRPADRGRPAGTPLGLLSDIDYDRIVVKPKTGDLVVLYSDGVSEATNPAREELGPDALMNVARAWITVPPKRLAASSRQRSTRFARASSRSMMKRSSCCRSPLHLTARLLLNG